MYITIGHIQMLSKKIAKDNRRKYDTATMRKLGLLTHGDGDWIYKEAIPFLELEYRMTIPKGSDMFVIPNDWTEMLEEEFSIRKIVNKRKRKIQ